MRSMRLRWMCSCANETHRITYYEFENIFKNALQRSKHAGAVRQSHNVSGSAVSPRLHRALLLAEHCCARLFVLKQSSTFRVGELQTWAQPAIFFPLSPRGTANWVSDISQVAWPHEPQLRYHVVRNGSLWTGGMTYATGPYMLQWVHASEYYRNARKNGCFSPLSTTK